MADSLLSLYVFPEGFDPDRHALASSARGYDLKPRQCAGEWCHRLFVPKDEDQDLCVKCQIEGRPKSSGYDYKTARVEAREVTGMAKTVNQKMCGRCKKPYQPTGNGQKYCVDCRPIVEHEAKERYKSAARKGPPRKVVSQPVVKDEDSDVRFFRVARDLLLNKKVCGLSASFAGGITITLSRTTEG